mgnify:CR=1 FL=1
MEKYAIERERFRTICAMYAMEEDTVKRLLNSLTQARLILGYRHPVTKPNNLSPPTPEPQEAA